MSNQIPRLPQSGWYTAEEWAEAFDKKPTTIRDWLKKHKIPHIHIESAIALRAEDFYRHAPKEFFDGEEEEGG